MTTVYFTISSTTHIPIQIAKWLAVCEAAASPRCRHGHCTLTDIQVVASNEVRVLCIVEDRDLDLILSIDHWAKVYSEEDAREAQCSIPLPSWVQMEHPTKGPRVSNLTCAKHLAEVLLALYAVFKTVDLEQEGACGACLLFVERKIANGLQAFSMARPLNEARLESIMNIADYWCVRLTSPNSSTAPCWLMPPMAPLPPMQPSPIKGSKEYRSLKRSERAEADRRFRDTEAFAEAERAQERTFADPDLPRLPQQWKRSDFPKLGRSPHGSPVPVTGRVAYADNALTVVPGRMPGQVALCIPSVPKIIAEDVKKLSKVAYLGLPEYNEHMWFFGKSQFDLRANIAALAA